MPQPPKRSHSSSCTTHGILAEFHKIIKDRLINAAAFLNGI